MTFRSMAIRGGSASLAVLLALAGPAAAAVDSAQAVTAKECGACHMVFPADMLPARSWTAIMAGLSDHFGENAALDPAAAMQIGGYLTTHAADASGMNKHALRGLAANMTPLRITDTPAWIRAHKGEVSPAAFTSPKVKSKSNCVACHAEAARGVFGDD